MCPEFLSTIGTSYQIDRIINEAVNEIIFITPDLNFHDSIILKMKQADQRNVRITLVYGGERSQVKSQKWHKNLKNLRVLYHEKINTRIYRNEKDMVLTSLSLRDFTATKYKDLGALMMKNRDRSAFEDGLYEQELLIESAEVVFSGENFQVGPELKNPEEIIREMPFLVYYGMEDRTLVNGKIKAPSGKFYSPEMEYYNDGTIKLQGFNKTGKKHGEWIFYTYEGFVREVVIYDNGSYVNKIFCDYENRTSHISKYYLLFGIGNSIRKLYGVNISDIYFESHVKDYTGQDLMKLHYHIERFMGLRNVFDNTVTIQDIVDQLYAALYK
ncbi:MAG: hypothetical protein JXA39_08885 [Bacteroidales bacterium]|nr:hypothetical protein [Bacteroidales bacterium]